MLSVSRTVPWHSWFFQSLDCLPSSLHWLNDKNVQQFKDSTHNTIHIEVAYERRPSRKDKTGLWRLERHIVAHSTAVVRTICEHTRANLATYQANHDIQLKRHALSCFLWRDATYDDRESLYADAAFKETIYADADFKEILKNMHTKQYSTHTADSFLIQLTSAYLRQCLAQCIPRKQDCSNGPVFRCCLLTQRGSMVHFLS